MSKYAKINSENIVENIIECEDSQIVLLEGNFVKISNDTNEAFIGGQYVMEKNKFIENIPYPSWTLNENTLKYDPPVEKPDGNFHWNEDAMNWIEFIPKPGPNYRWDEESNSWVEKKD